MRFVNSTPRLKLSDLDPPYEDVVQLLRKLAAALTERPEKVHQVVQRLSGEAGGPDLMNMHPPELLAREKDKLATYLDLTSEEMMALFGLVGASRRG